MIRILLDEHASPSLVGKLGDKGVFAVAATHVGLSGEPDAEIWNYAFENDFGVVTGNARDFIRLLNVEVHPGLIVLREGGLTPTSDSCRFSAANSDSACAEGNLLYEFLMKSSGLLSTFASIFSEAAPPLGYSATRNALGTVIMLRI